MAASTISATFAEEIDCGFLRVSVLSTGLGSVGHFVSMTEFRAPQNEDANMGMNDLLLFATLFGSVSAAVFFPAMGQFFQPYLSTS